MSLEVEKIQLSHDNKDFAYCAYTEKDEQLLRTCIIAKGNYDYTAFGKASINFGEGKIADEMKKLNLDKSNPTQVFYAENLDSELSLEYERLEK